MLLTPMRYKTFVWPHNPRIYEIDYRRTVAVHNVPFGLYTLQDMGRTCRVMKGEGEFCGQGAYSDFGRLACLFYEGTPGVLVHPLWQTASAYLVKLSLKQEPTEDYVAYTFEFWEDYDGYETGAIRITGSTAQGASASAQTAASGKKYHTVVYGDTMWAIARSNGLTLSALVAMNPQVKNPNLIYPGDVIRTA
jgi:prophage DNA circulation protein